MKNVSTIGYFVVVGYGVLLGALTTLLLLGCGGGPEISPMLGVVGPQGAPGQNGSDGKNGSNGENSLVNVQRFTSDYSVCTQGSGIIVKSGLDINNNGVLDSSEIQSASMVCDGANGTNGTNGTNGSNGTTVGIVQFCPGVTIYPSAFLEIGFCINNKIYAVYSANDGFLTLTPPGNYSSNAVGSSCNFTIGANCTISH